MCRLICIHLNRTRLECKDIKAIIEHCKEKDLNRTRLECKVHVGGFCLPLLTIWIEPDWNVKDCTSAVASITMLIWIEPDWNVKDYFATEDGGTSQIWIEPDWNVKITVKQSIKGIAKNLNRTRLECKANWIYTW